jgi:fermentation-respiration switch protein FrsA (DUF1100 family)
MGKCRNSLFSENFDQNKKYPTIVTMHPIGSCKEQTAGNVYGKALGEAGFVVLAFDASFQGESGGVPRYIENPYQRTDDVRYAVDYLINLPYVDEENRDLRCLWRRSLCIEHCHD